MPEYRVRFEMVEYVGAEDEDEAFALAKDIIEDNIEESARDRDNYVIEEEG